MKLRRWVVTIAIGPVVAVSALTGPSASGAAGTSAGPDFDGDGFGDLAIGAPTKDHGANGSGTVSVLYGGERGLSRDGDQLWSQDVEGIADLTDDFDLFGSALAWGDFDGDGFDDLVVGAPGEGLDDIRQGVVHVVPGSATGLAATGSQLWHQDVAGVRGSADADDSFGEAVTAGDFDADGYADLAVGVPRDEGSGAVAVLYGSPAGLTANRDQRLTQPGGADGTGALFGASLATGDVDGDGHDDLIVGAPFEDVPTMPNAGAVTVLLGSSAGLSEAARSTWSQASSGVLGDAIGGEHFGHAVSVGDADGDGFDDIAVAVRSDEVPGVGQAGAAAVLHGSVAGVTAEGNQLWSQDSPGVPGESEPAERVEDVALADLNSDGLADLAIGYPFEFADEPVLSIAGVVHVLAGSAEGITAAGAAEWTQDSTGVRDAVEEYDRFGSALSATDVDGDGFLDLVVGVPGEHVPPDDVQGGAVTIIRGSATGLTGAGDEFWSLDTRGVHGKADHLDEFGSVLS